MSKTLYKNGKDGLVSNPPLKISRRKIRRINNPQETINNKEGFSIGPSSTKGKERFERLRQKYLGAEYHDTVQQTKQQIPATTNVNNKDEKQELDVNQIENLKTINLKNTIEEPKDVNNDIKENNIATDKINDNQSKTSKISLSILQSLRSELEEEKKKRIELEKIVKELLSRTDGQSKTGSIKQTIS